MSVHGSGYRPKQDHQALLNAKYGPRVAAASRTQENKKKHVTLTFDRLLAIVWVSRGCQNTCSCKISWSWLQRFMSYRVHRETKKLRRKQYIPSLRWTLTTKPKQPEMDEISLASKAAVLVCGRFGAGCWSHVRVQCWWWGNVRYRRISVETCQASSSSSSSSSYIRLIQLTYATSKKRLKTL